MKSLFEVFVLEFRRVRGVYIGVLLLYELWIMRYFIKWHFKPRFVQHTMVLNSVIIWVTAAKFSYNIRWLYLCPFYSYSFQFAYADLPSHHLFKVQGSDHGNVLRLLVNAEFLCSSSVEIKNSGNRVFHYF